jgi:hypothetical protein
MSKTNNFVFIVVKIVAWMIFVGLCIEAGALIVNFVISLFKPDIVKNLYQKLDLSDMYEKSSIAYFCMYSFILCISILKAVLFYVVSMLVTKIDLSRPFNNFVSNQIFQISYYTFSIGLLSFIAQESGKRLIRYEIDSNNLNPFWEGSQGFILMAGVIYLIAIIFKKGLEIQDENDLTV